VRVFAIAYPYVKTVLEPASSQGLQSARRGTSVALSSRDLLLRDGKMTAMAASSVVGGGCRNLGGPSFAGSGRETSRITHCLMRPRGAAQRHYYRRARTIFAIQTSSIRQAGLDTAPREHHSGKGLFDFGDIDGDASKARFCSTLWGRLQRRLFYVADTTTADQRWWTRPDGADAGQVAVGRPLPTVSSPAPPSTSPRSRLAGRQVGVADTNNHRSGRSPRRKNRRHFGIHRPRETLSRREMTVAAGF
jgi:hypothetical protein